MFSDLIVGFDGCGPARDALALGRRLALDTGARPNVIYVRSQRGPTTEARDREDRVLNEARTLLADVPGASFQGSPARRWRARFTAPPRTPAPR